VRNYKTSKPEYGFLLDHNVSAIASLFPGKRARTLAQIGLRETARDEDIVRIAWELEMTIVTVDGDDFLKECTNFQNQTKRKDCHEMFGLVVLPNGYENQKRVLQTVRRHLRLSGARVSWRDVALKNLYVRVRKDGRAEIKRLSGVSTARSCMPRAEDLDVYGRHETPCGLIEGRVCL